MENIQLSEIILRGNYVLIKKTTRDPIKIYDEILKKTSGFTTEQSFVVLDVETLNCLEKHPDFPKDYNILPNGLLVGVKLNGYSFMVTSNTDSFKKEIRYEDIKNEILDDINHTLNIRYEKIEEVDIKEMLAYLYTKLN